MAVFPSFKLTEKGEELLNRSIGEGKTLTFTKFELGDGNPPNDFRKQTGLVNKFYEFPILNTSIQKDQVLRIRGYFDNKSFSQDKQLKEIGVFVKIEGNETQYLYSYTNAGDTGDIIPANSRGFYSRTLDVANYIGYATNITFNIEQLRDRYAFNTENEMKVASYLKVGDKVELWGNLVLGDKPTDEYIIQESGEIELSNGLFAKKVSFKYIAQTIEGMQKLALKVGDVVEVLGYYQAGDGAGHKRVIASAKKGFNSITLDNGLYGNLISDKEIKNIVLKKESKYPNASYQGEFDFVKDYIDWVKVFKINDKFKFEYEENRFGSEIYKEYIYIDVNSTLTGKGESLENAISLKQFKQNLDSGVYTKRVIVVYILNKSIMKDQLCGSITLTNKRLYLTSLAKGGTWITSYEKPVFDSMSGGIRTYNLPASDLLHVVEMGSEDKFGMPVIQKRVETEQELTKGTYCIVGDKVKTMMYVDSAVTDKQIYLVTRPTAGQGFSLKLSDDINLIENINFFVQQQEDQPSCCIIGNKNSENELPLIIMNNCKAIGGEQDAFGISGSYKVIMNNCVGAYPNKDCFNYHTSSKDSVALEINCIGYGAGMMKTKTGNQTTNSNNATTTHDGMTVIRFGSIGFNCEGGVLADVGGCRSINYNCFMENSTTQDDGYNNNYWYRGQSGNSNEFVLIGCKNGIINENGVYIQDECTFISDLNESILEKSKIETLDIQNVFNGGV